MSKNRQFTSEGLLYLTPREYCPEYYDELKRQAFEEKRLSPKCADSVSRVL